MNFSRLIKVCPKVIIFMLIILKVEQFLDIKDLALSLPRCTRAYKIIYTRFIFVLEQVVQVRFSWAKVFNIHFSVIIKTANWYIIRKYWIALFSKPLWALEYDISIFRSSNSRTAVSNPILFPIIKNWLYTVYSFSDWLMVMCVCVRLLVIWNAGNSWFL